MAVSFLNEEISELCLGKPELPCISVNATVTEALTALKTSGECQISVWTTFDGESATTINGDHACVCVGKICMTDVILFLAREENLNDPFRAFEGARVCDLLPKGAKIARQLEPNTRLWQAIDCMLEGTQNLVIPIHNPRNKNFFKRQQPSNHTLYNHLKYCWLTQENVIRFVLNSIGLFSPIPAFSIESLGLIDHEIMTVDYDQPAYASLNYLHRALIEQTSIAVVDEERRFVGEISPLALSYCDESASAALATLSSGEFVSYIDYGGPHEDLIQLVRTRLQERDLTGMLELMDECCRAPCMSSSSFSSSCSSDDECWAGKGALSRRNGCGSGRCLNSGRKFEVVMCSPKSSLVAVMIQALAHRVSCVWVVEDDRTLIGAVTFAGMLKVFRGKDL